MDTTAEGLTAENVKANDKATCDIHTDVLTLDAKTGDPTANYKFDFDNYTHGTLTVTKENVTDATDYVTINNASSIHAYENENMIVTMEKKQRSSLHWKEITTESI